MTYVVQWFDEDGEIMGVTKCQYIPDIPEVIRTAFGMEKADSVLVEKEPAIDRPY